MVNGYGGNYGDPYLPDGTPITTSLEEHDLRIAAETRAQEMEAELERLRQQLAHRQDRDIS